MPERVVDEYTHALMVYGENIYQEYGEWLDASMLIQAVEEMVNAKWEQAPHVGGRALEIAESILTDLPQDERGNYLDDIVELRRKRGLDERAARGSE